MASAWSIGPYEVIFRIGSGGMAAVFAARLKREAGFQKLVAVKRIHASLAADRAFTDMFLEEARVGAQVSGGHVIQTLDLGRDEAGLPYVVQELVVGADLHAILTRARSKGVRVPLGVAVAILVQAATGLHEAHEAIGAGGAPLGLVHRDVSPQNLIVGADGRVRVTDFGVARVAADRLVETATGVIKGKLGYLSPEQALAKPLDRRSDLFALGAVAWEMLAERPLFWKPAAAATLDAVKRAEIPHLSRIRPEVPGRIGDVVARALARPAGERYPTARDFAEALEAASAGVSPVPTERSVAALVDELAPPQLVALRDRIRQIAEDPTIVTLPDIDLPSSPSEEETVLDPTLPAGLPEDATVLDRKTPGSETAAAVTRRTRGTAERRPIAATEWTARPIPRSWVAILAIVLGATGLALGIAALAMLLSH